MKKYFARILGGTAVGILIGYLVAIIINLCVGGGEYMPAMPALMERCTSVMQAVLIQTLLTAVTGVVFALASYLFEIERWSFLKQCIVHFFATAVFYVPFTAFCWFTVDLYGVLGLLGSILVNYTIIFLINYHLSRRDVQQINDFVQQQRAALLIEKEASDFE